MSHNIYIYMYMYICLCKLQLSGFKKVLNYTKKVMEEVKYRNMFSREEVMSTLRYFCICKFRYETFLHNVYLCMNFVKAMKLHLQMFSRK